MSDGDWIKVDCGQCRGYGVVSDYRGGDFNGPMCCDGCGGSGVYYVHRSDRTALWPGGPFTGREPGRFERLRAKAHA